MLQIEGRGPRVSCLLATAAMPIDTTGPTGCIIHADHMLSVHWPRRNLLIMLVTYACSTNNLQVLAASSNHLYHVPIFCSRLVFYSFFSTINSLTDGWSPNTQEKMMPSNAALHIVRLNRTGHSPQLSQARMHRYQTQGVASSNSGICQIKIPQ